MMPVEYRVTQREDFVRFGLRLDDASRPVGWTAWAGRRAVGLGGIVVHSDGKAWGHFAAVEDYRDAVLRGLHRRTLKLLRRLGRAGVREIRTMCDVEIPKAPRWMQKLGFIPTNEMVAGITVHLRKS